MEGCAKNANLIALEVIITKDGIPDWDWHDLLSYQVSSNGRITLKQGAVLEGKFSKPGKINSVELKLNIKADDKNNITINGDSNSTSEFKITFMGISGKTSNSLRIAPGKQEVRYSGKLEKVY
jgi:hypothetical protein